MTEPAPNEAPSTGSSSSAQVTIEAPESSQPMQLRLAVAFAMAAWGAFIAYFALSTAPEHLAKDFSWPWRAARALLDGQNPYRVIRPTGPYPFNASFFYPLPAAIAALPFALFRPSVAGAAFVGLSSGLLAFGLARTRSGLAKLPLFASAPFCMAALLAQWSPLMLAGAVIPSLQFLGAAKPNVALPCFAYRPTLRGVLLGAAFVLVSSGDPSVVAIRLARRAERRPTLPRTRSRTSAARSCCSRPCVGAVPKRGPYSRCPSCRS